MDINNAEDMIIINWRELSRNSMFRVSAGLVITKDGVAGQVHGSNPNSVCNQFS